MTNATKPTSEIYDRVHLSDGRQFYIDGPAGAEIRPVLDASGKHVMQVRTHERWDSAAGENRCWMKLERLDGSHVGYLNRF